MLDTLFGLIPSGTRGQQWLAGDLQLVNWGGYDGAHRVRFSPSATLLCGGSGSGKSTLMDAYIALMMPHTTPFNGASNGAVTGRARGEDQRNILSYGRGKIDETRTEHGTRVRVLRGDGTDTWTAVAMTWVDASGPMKKRFTAVRAWYIPATARVLDDAVKVRGVIEGDFDLTDLEDAASRRLSDAAVRATGLETMATDREFLARIHAVLGIGAAGAGTKAMNLLARIQAGQQITTVDELYKRMVLEEPDTFATADAVVEHFDELEGTRLRMVTAQRQVRALTPLREARTRIGDAAERLRLIKEIGQFRDDSSPAAMWRTSRRLDLLRAAEEELRSQAVDAESLVATHTAAAEAAEAERDSLIQVLRNSGGDRLETAERELGAARRRCEQITRTREKVEEDLIPLGAVVTDEEAFTALVAQGKSALADPEVKAGVRESYAEARTAASVARDRWNELESEKKATAERTDNIPGELHAARAALAEAAGLSVDELPFVGELVEVRTEFEPWREAFNLALGGFATTLLIDETALPQFRAAINQVRTRIRVPFEGVQTGQARITCDPRQLPGRLDYRDTPFTGWLQDRLDQRFGFVCVDSAEELRAHRSALTVSGQMSQGARGAHGGHGRRNVLGFSSHRRVDELAGEIAAAKAEVEAASSEVSAAEAELDAVDVRLAAYRRIVDLTWEEIDVATVTDEVTRWEEAVEGISEGSPEIAAMQNQIAGLKVKIQGLQEKTGRAKGEHQHLMERWDAVAEEIDEAEVALDEAAEAGRELTGEQDAWLRSRFTVTDGETGDPAARLARLDASLESASRVLEEDRASAQTTLADQRAAVRRTMESFLDAWPNPNLRADPDASLKDFERILDDLETSG
ncbi:ATP-binding protein, partial [Corynebacterium variabile]